jgi:hypothetical protein
MGDSVDDETRVAAVDAGQVSLRLTGVSPAMLAVRRSIRRSSPLEGSSPACRAVMAASQSVLARRLSDGGLLCSLAPCCSSH